MRQQHILKQSYNPDKILKELKKSSEMEFAHVLPGTQTPAFYLPGSNSKKLLCDVLIAQSKNDKINYGTNWYTPNMCKEVGAHQTEINGRIHTSFAWMQKELTAVLNYQNTLAEKNGVELFTGEVLPEEIMNTMEFVKSLPRTHPDRDEKTKDIAGYYHFHIDQLQKQDHSLPFKATTCSLQIHLDHRNPDINEFVLAVTKKYAHSLFNNNIPSSSGSQRGPARYDVVISRNGFVPPTGKEHRTVVGGAEPMQITQKYLDDLACMYFPGREYNSGEPRIHHGYVAKKHPGNYTTELRRIKSPKTGKDLADTIEEYEQFVRDALTSDFAKETPILSVDAWKSEQKVMASVL